MYTRNRSRNTIRKKGGTLTTTTPGLSGYSQPDIWGTETMTDVVGNMGGVNPLSSAKRQFVLGRYSGQCGYFRHMDTYITDPLGSPGSVPGTPSDAAVVTSMLNFTNPSRPYVDPGMLIQDLVDLPKMVRDIGDFIKRGHKNPSSRMVASGFLGWTFGWLPLFRDLQKLLNFQSAVEKRKKVLRSLRSGGQHSTYTAFDGTYKYPSYNGYFVTTYGTSPYGTFQWEAKAKKWGSVTYRLTADSPPLDESGIDAVAQSLVFGMNLSMETLWDLMPWTWLIDWFANVGDILGANRNVLRTQATNICVMEQIQAWCISLTLIGTPGTVTVDQSNGIVTKSRRIGFTGPSLVLQIPFLDGTQWSILSALAVQRLGK